MIEDQGHRAYFVRAMNARVHNLSLVRKFSHLKVIASRHSIYTYVCATDLCEGYDSEIFVLHDKIS